MRVATWNINGLRARFDFVLHWLRARQPEVVALQELKVEEEKFPFAAFEDAGYRAVAHGQAAWNGVAVLSRETAEVLHKGLPGEAEQGARLIAARIGELRCISIYCPNGKQVGHPDFEGKLKWLDSLLMYLREYHRPGDPLLLCGDFNICPTPLDTWNEEGLRGTIFHTEQERIRFQRLLDFGLEDVYRTLFPTTHAFSWWDYRAGAFHKNQGLRIDFLLATRAVVERAVSAEIDRDYRKKKEGLTASDHAPVLVDLK